MGLNARADFGHRRIGVFGGTFDPIHRGHIEIARFALCEADLDLLLLVPAGQPWLRNGPPTASPQHRLRMTELAAAGEPDFEVSDVDVMRAGETYTADTLADLREQFGPDVEFVLVLGADSALGMDRWKCGDELQDMCRLLVIGRPGQEWPEDMAESHPAHGAEYLEGPMIDVSGTDLRERLASGDDVSDSIPEPVATYIREHGLYRE